MKYYAVYRELTALVFEEAPKNLDAIAQAARSCDSIHVFRLLYGSDYLLVRAAAHIHDDFPKPRFCTETTPQEFLCLIRGIHRIYHWMELFRRYSL